MIFKLYRESLTLSDFSIMFSRILSKKFLISIIFVIIFMLKIIIKIYFLFLSLKYIKINKEPLMVIMILYYHLF